MHKLIIGNWKMALGYKESVTLAENLVLSQPYRPLLAEVGVCPSFVALSSVANILEGTAIFWGAQDATQFVPGPVTGGTSLESLVELDCRYVILGHSERRQLFGETDELVRLKLQAVLERTNLIPIVCVGETLAEREAGQAEEKVGGQLRAIFNSVVVPAGREVVLAYEPIWAIGTGKTSTPTQAEAMHHFIRQFLKELGIEGNRILYGGSVKPENAGQLLSQPNIDGLLVGGASLSADSFWSIVFA
ncbi:triose-phosphate isomerase [Patescibacteria group bacterium]|nr:triose-phosphate isomerase [Patescibacteria group bacterium]